jgi:hypothetical protein
MRCAPTFTAEEHPVPRYFFNLHDSETRSEDPRDRMRWVEATRVEAQSALSGLGCTKSGLRATEPVFEHPCAGQRVTF